MGKTIIVPSSAGGADPNLQALIDFEKGAPQIVSTLSGQNDNIISFNVQNSTITAPLVLDFDGTIISLTKRHPTLFTFFSTNFFLSNSNNSAVTVTINFLASIDGGATFPLLLRTRTVAVLPKSGSNSASAFPPLLAWIQPQPAVVPIKVKVQIFASVAGVLSVEAGSTIGINHFYKD